MNRNLDGQDKLVHSLASKHQSGATCVKLVLPESGPPRGTLYLLPVEPGEGDAWGSPLTEVLKHDLHNQYRLTCVQPTFSAMLWYADHPTDQRSQQERYFIEDVVPLVEREYPDLLDGYRLLLGFSKSGYGVFSLLLRHPDLFAKAAAWDAPLGMTTHNRYGAAQAFGTQENFDKYNVWDLLRRSTESLGDRVRLGLFGYESFRGHMQATHFQMTKLGIPHHYADGPQRKHAWDGDWLPELVEFLAREGERLGPCRLGGG